MVDTHTLTHMCSNYCVLYLPFKQEHQLAVVDCLEDPDDTLKLKTLELLYKMTKVRERGGDGSNTESIRAARLLNRLRWCRAAGQYDQHSTPQ